MSTFLNRLIAIEIEEPVTIPSPLPGGAPRTVLVKVPAKQDPKDGEVYLDRGATDILDQVKARHMGILSPQELRSLRQRLGMTQADLAAALQIGERSWTRWETGRDIPSRSMNLLILGLAEGRINLPWLRDKGLIRQTGSGLQFLPRPQIPEWNRLLSSEMEYVAQTPRVVSPGLDLSKVRGRSTPGRPLRPMGGPANPATSMPDTTQPDALEVECCAA